MNNYSIKTGAYISASDGGYKIYNPPKANWRWKFGDSPDVYFQFHIKNPPNRFQRWLFEKMLGIKWERIE